MLNRDKSAKIRESDNMFWKAKPEFQLSIKRCEVRNHDGAESRKINLQRQLHFHQPSHPDFPATEPDDRVNGMAARAVHVDEVNPEKSAPLGGDVGGIKKWKPLIYKGFRVVVTVGLEPTTPSM